MARGTRVKKRAHIYYSGHVQGVGFRYTTEDIARSMKLTGWVKNLPDRRVEVVCEGEELVIKDFLGTLEKRMDHYIDNKEIAWQECKDEFQDFGINFY